MIASMVSSPQGRLFRFGLTTLALASLFAPVPAKCDQAADDQTTILRFDPINGTLTPIAKEEMRPGYIYNHFSPRLKRRVWSYVRANGEFWYAFGEGTTQEAFRLDIRVSAEEALKKLQQVAPELAQEVRYRDRRVYLRLNRDNQWEIDQTATGGMIYNLETGQRWQQIPGLAARQAAERPDGPQGGYIPVVHTRGSQWGVERGKYVPLDTSWGTPCAACGAECGGGFWEP